MLRHSSSINSHCGVQQLQGLLLQHAAVGSSSCCPGVLQQLAAWAACRALTCSAGGTIEQPCSSADDQQQQQQQQLWAQQHMPHTGVLHQPSRCLPLSQLVSHIQPGRLKHTAAYSTGSSRQAVAQTGSAQTQQVYESEAGKLPPKQVSRQGQGVFSRSQVLRGGRYKLQELVSIQPPSPVRGKQVTLWRGKDLELGRNVMIKCLEAGDTSSYAAGMREAALYAAAGRCPNIVALTDAFEHRSSSGRHPVMVWSPLGETLTSVVRQYHSRMGDFMNEYPGRTIRGGICDRAAPLKKLARDVLTALDFLHRRGLVHTDLSLDNVVLDRPFMAAQQLRAETRIPKHESARLHLLQKRSWWAREMAGNSRKGLQLTLQLEQEVAEAITFQAELRNVHFEGSLHTARYRLRDLSQAVAFSRQLPFCPSGQQVHPQAQALLKAPQLFQKDGSPVRRDRDYQAPEEVLGMPYLAPSYDMWKFGCLMFEAATNCKLFSGTRLREQVERRGELGYGEQDWLLADMVEKLGYIPRSFGLKAPLRGQFFYQSSAQYDPYADMLKIHAGAVEHNAGRKPLENCVRLQTVLDEYMLHTQLVALLTNEDEEKGEDWALLTAGEAKAFADFLSQVVRWTPESRATAADLLRHPWLQENDDDESE